MIKKLFKISDKEAKASLKVIKNYFWKINWIKTIFFNFKVLPFKQAIKIPIILSYNVKIKSPGKIIIHNKVFPGQISIGVIRLNTLEDNSYKILFNNWGTIHFNGRFKLHPGVRFLVSENATCSFGARVGIGACSKMVCSKSISIGDDTRISWNCQVFDTDFHFLSNVIKSKVYPRKKAIIIGNNVFIGNSSTISKGTHITNGSVISCCSKVNGSFEEQGDNLLISGNPAKVVNIGFNMSNGWFPEIENMISLSINE